MGQRFDVRSGTDARHRDRWDRARARDTAREARRGDRGFTVTEVVVTIALLGIVVLPIMDAVMTGIKASAVNRSAAQVETAIVNAADRVNRAPKRCDYTIYAQAAVQTQGWAPTNASVGHEYFEPGTDTWHVGSPGAPGCAGVAPTDLLVQRVTITITSPDGKIRRSIQVVKSDV